MKVKNVSGQVIHTSKGILMPWKEAELNNKEAERLKRLKLVVDVPSAPKKSGGNK